MRNPTHFVNLEKKNEYEIFTKFTLKLLCTFMRDFNFYT